MARHDSKPSGNLSNTRSKDQTPDSRRPISAAGASVRSAYGKTLASPPPGRARSITSVLIAVYVLWQLVLPLTYYLGDDRSDERFAWRMFSAVNYLQRTCIVSLGEWRPGGDLRPLKREEFIEMVPLGWRRLLHRDRDAVIRKFLWTHCQGNPELVEAELIRKCKAEDGMGASLDSMKMNCGSGVFTRAQEIP